MNVESKVGKSISLTILELVIRCCNPILRECEDEIHTLEIGTWESSGTPKTSKFDRMGQNTSHKGVFYIIEKLSKYRC